jgi:Lon protease-like protein
MMDTTHDVSLDELALPAEVALFPLPDHVLMPGIPAPYRVFEPRYRTLVEDLLNLPEQERWICVPRLAPGWKSDYHGRPPIHSIATLGRVVTCEPLAGGHYFILVEGVTRARLVECTSDKPYRLACVEPWNDLTVVSNVPGGRRRIIESLSQAVYTLSQIVGGSASDLTDALMDTSDIERLVYRLGAAAIDDPDERQRLLEERCIVTRTGLVIQALSELIALSSCHLGASTPA